MPAGRWWVLMVVVGLLAPAVVARPAAATGDAIDRKRREAARIADRLEALDEEAAVLQEDWADAQLELQQLDAKVERALNDVVATEGRLRATGERAAQWAVRTYVEGRAAPGVVELLAGASATEAAYRQGYADLALGNDRDLADRLAADAEDLDRARLRLEDQQDRQRALAADLEERRRELDRTIAEAEALERRVQGQLATLVRQEEERRRREAEAAARAAAARAAAARQAARQAASGSSGAPAPARPARTIPPPSPGAAGAVEAALSVIGTPYRWATSDPAVGFDCSGLIIWAWGRAGRGGLPHSSRALYANLPKVAIEDLQPGDLVFFGSPRIHHAGLYIGNGQMVHAPRRGKTVEVATIFRRNLVGASRP